MKFFLKTVDFFPLFFSEIVLALRHEDGRGDFGKTALRPSDNSKYDSVRSTSLRPTGTFFSLPAFATLAFSAKKKTSHTCKTLYAITPEFLKGLKKLWLLLLE